MKANKLTNTANIERVKSVKASDIDSCSALPKYGQGYCVFIIEFMR